MSDEKDFIEECLENLLPFLQEHFKTKTKLFFDRSVYDMVIDWINQNIYVISFDIIERFIIEQRGVVQYIDQTYQLDQINAFFLAEKAKFEEDE
jgi:hypothetical protein